MWGLFLHARGWTSGGGGVQLEYVPEETPRSMTLQRNRILCREAHMWTVFKAWRYSVVRKKEKRDLYRMSDKERDIKFIYEESLLLHDLLITTDVNLVDRRLELVQYVYATALRHDDSIAVRVDRQSRTVLHLAVLLTWDVDDIAWVVGINPDAAGVPDCDGFSPLTYATLYGRRDESILQMAVPLARKVQANASRMMAERNYEGSKRTFLKATRDFFSGVPRFDQTFVEEAAATLDAKAASEQILDIWTEFLSVWGHFDPPLVVTDLASKRRVTVGSRVLFTVQAKGEPLTYQWYCDGSPLEGCTTDTLDATGSATPEDAGAYFCRITNWRGSVDSTTAVLLVQDDTVVVDPSTRYFRTQAPLAPGDVLFNVNAAVGGVLDVGHVQLFVPPRSFAVWDLFDANLADTLGMDVVVRVDVSVETTRASDDVNEAWQVVSPIVSLSPHPVDAFLIPWTLRLPHHAASVRPSDPSLIMVLQRIVDADGVVTMHTVSPHQLRVYSTHVDVDLLALGTFVVVQKPSRRVRMTLVLFASTDQLTVDSTHVDLVVWSCPTRQDCLDVTLSSNSNVLHVGNFPLELPSSSPPSTLVQIDLVSPNKMLLEADVSLSGSTPRRLGVLHVPLGESATWTSQGVGMACPQLRVSGATTNDNLDVVLPLRFHENRPVGGGNVLQHTTRHVEVAWTVNPPTTGGSPPPYFVVEMAAFSDTFWRRYSNMWWFDRANLSVVHRMYKVTHMGAYHHTHVHIVTDVHAASIRIAACNLDSFGEYADNLLVTPESIEVERGDDNTPEGAEHERQQKPHEGKPKLGGGGVTTTMMLMGLTEARQDSHQRLQDLVAAVYPSSSLFQALYGVPNTISDIVSMLESKKRSHRAADEGIALLLVGLDALILAAKSTVHFHRPICMHFCQCLALAARVTPALDLNFASAPSILVALHHALQAMFQLVQTHATAGWFTRFLVADKSTVQSTMVEILETLVTACRDHAVFGAEMGQGLLRHWEAQRQNMAASTVNDADELRQLHAWSVVLHAQQDRKLSLQYFSKAFHTDMLEELNNKDRIAEVHADVQQRNTLKTRVLHVCPGPGDVVAYTAWVEVRFDGAVVDVDCLRFITVKNTTLKVRVNGNVTYDKGTRTALFAPTVPLEPRSTFKVKLRADAVTTWYGAASATTKHMFTTKPK
ncbi:hypothetical protein H257_04560 [Aphanomyces astaci]|uniref:Ig-like domain-containing protein n=1 Tax=Aphanomyces astaci TaxID=112090 RepID=W4GV16_APHAT|nr:hypothetical protein H257_04560 [Aphanomyces astaci]ETV82763.1 hypothetical protein H257_04560 [Aphanomyces astaci]|eukprot:XP_009827434.1 hypothetical protein H257_04560 [Aphanomyces astaci]